MVSPSGSAWAGLGAGILAAVSLSLVHGFAAITWRGNQIVSGVAINMLAAGLTVILGNAWFGQGGRTPTLEGAARFGEITLPFAQTLREQVPGFGLIYEQREVLEETERTQFAAAGTVRTTDGREIRFTLQLDMQRSYREESSVSLRLGDAVAVDPLVINFDGTAAQLQDQRFAFDLNGDGETENVPLLAGNRGYLALDTNQNALIDNGLELFGPGTGNGFAELARHDSDGNGWIDEADPVYQQLRVWTPSADGAGRLQTLAELGVGAVQTAASAATPFALRTADNTPLGAVRSTSIYLRENGSAGTVQQIDLSV